MLAVGLQRRGPAVPGQQRRSGHHRLRPAQRDRQGRRPARDVARAEGGWPGPRAGVLRSHRRLVQADLRLPFVPDPAQAGQAVRQRFGQLPVPGREHPQAPAAGRTEGDDGAGRFRALPLQEPDRRHRLDPFRLQAVSRALVGANLGWHAPAAVIRSGGCRPWSARPGCGHPLWWVPTLVGTGLPRAMKDPCPPRLAPTGRCHPWLACAGGAGAAPPAITPHRATPARPEGGTIGV
ncbi:hypothetical protein G6F57_017256 [Rhizopus arrhizus]|nr:hypothetical protein G6F57_017256 [Rhizopus arrhizus]